MVLVTYENCNIVYFTNAINKMYYNTPTQPVTDRLQFTGWHYIPNQSYSNWLVPRQWFDLITNHDKFRLHSVECTVQNMIPLTDNLSIAQDTTFISFNNTIYALGYTDQHYETVLKESSTDLKFREGVMVNVAAGTASARMTLPIYQHIIQNNRTVYSWDPFIHPSSLMELRPGKNAIKFAWSRNEADNDKWYSTARYYTDQDFNDDTNNPKVTQHSGNYINMWMCPYGRHHEEPNNDQWNNKQINIYNYVWKYPINNWFIKMIPIFNTKDNNPDLLKHTAQAVLVRKITFEVTPRTNTTNFPQLATPWANDAQFVGTGALNPAYNLAERPAENVGINPPVDAYSTNRYITTVPATGTTDTVTYSRRK